MYKTLFITFILLFLVACSDKDEEPVKILPISAEVIEDEPFPGLETVGEKYRVRYPLKNASQKLVDNRGNGRENLYGTRNFRAVLNGVYYRGGANNVYHRKNKRGNSNPLPNDGLQNLCEEGFGTAIYLYTTNYNSAPKLTNCRTFDGYEGKLDYKQLSALNGDKYVRQILLIIYEHIKNERLGPVYAHCWNGWHSSGFTAVAALKQFCGFTSEQAVAYWNLNTDGNNGSAYDSVRKKIRSFTPYADLKITDEEKKSLCPDPNTLQFR